MASVASCFFLAVNLYIRAVYQCQKLCLLDLDDDRWWVFFSNLVFLAFMKQWDSCLHKYQTQALLRIMVQLEASGYICAKSSCIWGVHKPPPFPFLQELWIWSHPTLCHVELDFFFPAALVMAGMELGVMDTLRGLGELLKLEVLTKLLNSCPWASPALEQRVISGFKALLIFSPHFSS